MGLVRRSGLSIAQISRDLDIGENSLRSWVKQADIDDGRGPDGELTTSEREELRRLRRENRQLLLEKEFLKKSGGLLRERPDDAYEVMRAEQARYPVSLMCKEFEVSCGGFYA